MASSSLGRVGRYEIVRVLGQGGMGTVYLARQTDLARTVVVKVITTEDGAASVERFRREAVAIGRISSDNVVKVFELGTDDAKHPFIAMEYVEGASLDNVVAQRRALPFEEATRIVFDAARGLQAAHEVGVLHRDVKPANILLTREGRAKVTDFGLARIEKAAALTQAGYFLGTPAYMAPEQAEGREIDARADVYALGVTYYELLTGRLPFPGKNVTEVLQKKFEGTYAPPSSHVPLLPKPVEAVCMRLMEFEPERRPASMAEAIRALQGLLETTAGRPPTARLSPALAAALVDRGASTVLGAPTPLSPGAETRTAEASGPAEPGVAIRVPGPFGRFQLERVLGEGGMGTVYAARELELDRPCVVKVVKRDLARKPEVVERLRREANAAAKIASDLVVRVFDFGVVGETPFISMELVDGSSVEALLGERGRLPALDATRIVLAAARGLRAAHEQGVLHRDVKPSNVLVARDGRVKVADFGLAKDVSAGPLTAPGAVIGTPAYMSPEQIDAEPLDGRSDVYSLGATYYELLTGTVAFPGTTVMTVLANRAKPLRAPRAIEPSVPEIAERACLALMEPLRARRPEMSAAIAALEKVVARLEQPAGAVAPRGERTLVLAAILGVLAVLGVVGTVGAILLLGRR